MTLRAPTPRPALELARLVRGLLTLPALAFRERPRPAHGRGVPVIAVGELCDEERCEAIRKAGVEWALRTPIDESALRWVVNSAMFKIDSRREYERVPIEP